MFPEQAFKNFIGLIKNFFIPDFRLTHINGQKFLEMKILTPYNRQVELVLNAMLKNNLNNFQHIAKPEDIQNLELIATKVESELKESLDKQDVLNLFE